MHSFCTDMKTYFDNYNDFDDLKRISKLEIFDEIEEWNLMVIIISK